MKNNYHQIFILIFVCFFACSNKKQKYQEDDLFFKYLNSFKEEIIIEKYQLLTYRTKGLCATCRAVPLDTVLLKAIANKKATLFVLFDNDVDLLKTKHHYGDKIKYLIGNEQEMNRHGIPKLEPLLYTIENDKIISIEYFSEF